MPTPKVELALKYFTSPQVRKRLSLSRYQLDLRIERGVFSKPTYVDTSGVRYFDEQWLRTAKAILDNAVQPDREAKK
jgi:hypothetical protein